jgi:hypothetical protein
MKHIYGYILLTLLVLGLLPATAVAQSATALGETYVSDDETMTLRYPTGWFIDSEQPGLVIVASNENAFDVGDEPLAPGQAVVAVVYSTAEDEYLQEYFSGDDPVEVLDTIIETLFSAEIDPFVEFTPAQTATFGDDAAARSDGLFMKNHIFLVVAADSRGDYRLVIGLTAEADYAKYEPKLLAIAESVNYLPRTE